MNKVNQKKEKKVERQKYGVPQSLDKFSVTLWCIDLIKFLYWAALRFF
jgi:hypothetical protein